MEFNKNEYEFKFFNSFLEMYLKYYDSSGIIIKNNKINLIVKEFLKKQFIEDFTKEDFKKIRNFIDNIIGSDEEFKQNVKYIKQEIKIFLETESENIEYIRNNLKFLIIKFFALVDIISKIFYFDENYNIDEKFLNYKILHFLGKGSNGMVFIGLNTLNDKKIVIKRTNDSDEFTNSSKLMKVCNVNIMKCNELINWPIKIFEHNEYFYIVYNYFENYISLYELREEIKNNKQIFSKFVNDLDEALGYFHSIGFAHLDLKLNNIIGKIENNNIDLKLIDFGSSCNDSDSCAESIGGTYEYVDPFSNKELPRNLIVAQNNDKFAFGVCVYFIITGEYPKSYNKTNETYNKYYDFTQDTNYEKIYKYLIEVPNLKDFDLDYLLSNKY